MAPADDVRIAPSATVEAGASVGPGTKVWDGARVRSGATVGAGCTIGGGAYIDAGVVIGDRCKVQDNCLVYAPARLADGVFLGPGVVLTNDRHPRAVEPDGRAKQADDWHAEGVDVGEGAALGAGAIVVAGCRIGAWALVAAGAVVASDVSRHQLVAGVPARPLGWVGRAGHRLVADGPGWSCPATGERYRETPEGLFVDG